MLYKQLTNYIEAHQNQFYRVAYSYAKNHDDALDIVQDTIYAALKSYKKIKNPEYLKTWFYRILINQSITCIRKRKPTESIDTITTLSAPQSLDTIDLYNALDHLDADDKTIIILRYFEDLKFSTISTILELNINTIKTRHKRILKSLKLTLEEEVMS